MRLDDESLIDRLQRQAFGYFGEHTHPYNGLVADNSDPSAPASIAAVGFGLTALPVGVERGWIGKSAALQRALTAARFFKAAGLEEGPEAISKRGFFYHFLDMETGRRAWRSEISSIDTAILALGLLACASYFNSDTPDEQDLRSEVDAIVRRIDWRWMTDRNGLLRMGWKPERGWLNPRWTGYSEALLIYAMAIGADETGQAMRDYRRWRESFRWIGDDDASYVHAGPLFTHLFPHVWLDLEQIAVAPESFDYRENSRRAIDAQRRYADENPNGFIGYSSDIWGLSACPGPARRVILHDGRRVSMGRYLARAVPYGPDDGTLLPWAALACLPLDREAAMSGLREVLQTYPGVLMGGRFVDAFNPSIRTRTGLGWHSCRTTALDQGLVVAMVENARTGLIHDLLRMSPHIGLALERLCEAS